MTLASVIYRLHVWAGAILGVQMFIWLLSGVAISWLDRDIVQGERSAFLAPAQELDAKGYASPGGVIAQVEGATTVTLRHHLGRPAYQVNHAEGASLFDADTGRLISPIDASSIRKIAGRDFVGDGEIKSVSLVDNPPKEYRGRRPIWRVTFDDRINTRLYISPETGLIAARRNDTWRTYDIFQMLHFLDFQGRGEINNPVARMVTLGALAFAASGFIMFCFEKPRRYLAADLSAIAERLTSKKQ
ncbi:MAG: hypothetical protein AAGB02_05770 [Pseudomonadota bacterium]